MTPDPALSLGRRHREAMKLTPRFRKIAAISVGVVGLAITGLSVIFSLRPVGCFGSYKMLRHDPGDVLRFTNGVVLQETCCGQMDLGTYARSSDGTWIWYYSTGRKKVYTNEFILRPGLFWLTCTEVQTPTNTWRLPRRLFAPKEMD